MTKKPAITIMSEDQDDTLNWVSEGWYHEGVRGTPSADRLFKRAQTEIRKAKDVPDAVRRLEATGFEIHRTN